MEAGLQNHFAPQRQVRAEFSLFQGKSRLCERRSNLLLKSAQRIVFRNAHPPDIAAASLESPKAGELHCKRLGPYRAERLVRRVQEVRFADEGERQMQVVPAAEIAVRRMVFEPCNRSAEHILARGVQTDRHKKPHVSHLILSPERRFPAEGSSRPAVRPGKGEPLPLF